MKPTKKKKWTMDKNNETSQCPKNCSYVEEFLESRRKKARTCLTTNEKSIEDLEYMLKSVQALIKVINETWDRCEKYTTTTTNNENNNGEENAVLTFKRELYEEVKVVKVDRLLSVTTRKRSRTRDFGRPPSVPENLKDLINFTPPENSISLPDYNVYLDKSAILCKEVLLSFLTGLQDHLKNVQVYLGEIEEWLIEPSMIVTFLNQLFGINKEVILNEGKSDENQSVNTPSNKNVVCIRCLKCLKDHVQELGENENVYLCSDKQESAFNNPLLKNLYQSYCSDVDCQMDYKFNVSTEYGRKKLETIVPFIKTYKSVKIVVKGAGVASVNGVYTIDGIRSGAFRYSRIGDWEGKPARFVLYRICRGNDNYLWCIDSKSDDEDDVEIYDIVTKGTRQDTELPTVGDWTSYDPDTDPPPQILHEIDG